MCPDCVLLRSHRRLLQVHVTGTVQNNHKYFRKNVRDVFHDCDARGGLAVITGLLLLVALAVMIVGPRFGEWLAERFYLSGLFVWRWPVIHWTVAIGFTVLAVEVLYFIAPNVKQRFRATLPGAILSVTFWIGLSYLLGLYFRHFADYNRTYGTLGGFIAFMTWFYWTSFSLSRARN